MANISPSLLKDYIKDPYYMYRKHVLKEIKPRQTPSMLIGSMIDCYLTEGFEVFIDRYKATKRRNLKNPPADYQEVTPADYEKAVRIASTVCSSKLFREIKKYDSQVYLNHPHQCGIFDALSGRPDWIHIDEEKKEAIIVDLKTTAKVEPSKFGFEMRDFEYYMQLAFYGMLVKYIYGIENIQYYILAVENNEPYRIYLYQLAPTRIIGEEMRISFLLDEIDKMGQYKPKDLTFDDAIVI